MNHPSNNIFIELDITTIIKVIELHEIPLVGEITW